MSKRNLYVTERLAMGATRIGSRIGWYLGFVLADVLWAIKPLRPRLERWALSSSREEQ